jgi:uncharacterized membrane protein YagU involved in acid resistance
MFTHRRDHDPATRKLRDYALASFGATLVLTSIIRFAQALGFTRIDRPMMLGTILTPNRDRAKIYGVLVHVVNGWLFGAIDIATFHSWRRSNVWVGSLIGFVHGIFVLVIVIPLLPGAHRRMASDFTGPQPTTGLEPPGFLALNYGRNTAFVTLFAHVVYGGILGQLYRVHPPDQH